MRRPRSPALIPSFIIGQAQPYRHKHVTESNVRMGRDEWLNGSNKYVSGTLKWTKADRLTGGGDFVPRRKRENFSL